VSVAIVADSTCDLAPEVARAHGIDVVPLFVNFGTRRFRDGVELSHAEFYQLLATEKELPTTSQPTAAMFEDAFRPHVAAGRPIVCLTIMQSLSGTINAAQAAAAQFPGAQIHLVDSESVAGGLALQALHAARLARAGASAGDILAALARDRTVQRGYATFPDLSHLVRTGRISRAQAFIGSLVKIVPVLRLDSGRIGEEARVRTFARAQDAMIEATRAGLGTGAGAYIGILHTSAPELAQKLRERIEEHLTGEPAYIGLVEAGPVIATHAGIGAVGIFSIPGLG
jgi:DegV family protein with EDD domain